MTNKAVSTGKNVSIWMDNETVDALENESKISGVSKSKVVRVAIMRYAEEASLEREYISALGEIRNKKYE